VREAREPAAVRRRAQAGLVPELAPVEARREERVPARAEEPPAVEPRRRPDRAVNR
jgi:hypothetical protein